MKSGEQALERSLGLRDCVFLGIGNMVGTGVFLTTSSIASALPSGGLILAAWLVGGVFALTGALTYAEMGTLFPRAGGHYVYMREAYGPFWGFVDGWVSFVAGFPCTLAFMAVGLARYLSYFFPWFSADHVLCRVPLGAWALPIHGGHVPALAAVIALTVVNGLGLRVGRNTQNLFTALKIAALLGLTAVGLFFASGDWHRVCQVAPVTASLWQAFGSALIGVSFAYLGWDAATYMAAECRNPQQTLPRALAIATAAVVTIYLLFNAALLRLVPVAQMPGSANVAQDAAGVVLGRAGTAILSAVIILCIVGAMNATIMVGPRVCFAMAEDGLFFRGLARVHARFHVPTAAIVAQSSWTCLIILTGTFDGILAAAVFAMVSLSTATAAAIFALRFRLPDMPRPYRTLGYPWVPILYCAGSLGILLNALVERPGRVLWSATLLATGIPVYLYSGWRHRRLAVSE
jgi:APA family basic amino acid/polyamine antiporter